MTPHEDAQDRRAAGSEAGEVRVVIAGGGTGGHLTPALALARELVSRPRPARVTLIGGDRGPDREVYGGSGLPYRILSAPRVERAQPVRDAGARERGPPGGRRPPVRCLHYFKTAR